MDNLASSLAGSKIVALSARAWETDEQHCQRVVACSLARADVRFLMLDAPGLVGVKPFDQEIGDSDPVRVSLADWLRISAQHYSSDEERIAGDLRKAAGRMLWIDARAFDVDALQDVLRHMRRILFASEQWPRAMIFILRDDFLPDAMDLLPVTFYVLPTVKSQREASVQAYDIYRVARAARLFGWSPRSRRLFFRAGERMKEFWLRRLKQDEVDRIR